MAAANLTASILRECVTYDANTGHFTRKKKTGKRVVVGARADFETERGYCRVVVENKRVYAHRAAWIYVYGSLPDAPIQIDHINGIKSDNRIENLRAVSPSVNSQNERKARPNAQSGLLGAHWHEHTGKWRSQIKIGARCIYLGIFDTALEAHNTYLEAKRKHHIGCTI